jgi:hypothetical protein
MSAAYLAALNKYSELPAQTNSRAPFLATLIGDNQPHGERRD